MLSLEQTNTLGMVLLIRQRSLRNLGYDWDTQICITKGKSLHVLVAEVSH